MKATTTSFYMKDLSTGGCGDWGVGVLGQFLMNTKKDCVGLGTICSFRHPLEMLECIPLR